MIPWWLRRTGDRSGALLGNWLKFDDPGVVYYHFFL